MARAPADGLGIAFVSERGVVQAIKTGKLVVVLDEWCPRIPGLALYYPGHRQVPAGLRAFVEVLKETETGKAQASPPPGELAVGVARRRRRGRGDVPSA
jgi:DNA-binding transcriptional LysR family regulator